MSSRSPEESPTPVGREAIVIAAGEVELRAAVRREELWIRINTAFLAMLLGILAFFGRDLYFDVKGHTGQLGTLTAQLSTLTARVDDIKEKVDKIATDTEQNGRSLAEIKGFL